MRAEPEAGPDGGEELPRASPGSDISVENPIYQAYDFGETRAKHCASPPAFAAYRAVTAFRHDGSSEVSSAAVWHVESSFVQAAINERKRSGGRL